MSLKIQDRRGPRLALRRFGSRGPSVLVAHGGPGSTSRTWDRVLSPLTDLAQWHLYDFRGCRDSRDSGPRPAPSSMQSDLEDLIRLLDLLPRPRWILGHSYGGMLALRAAIEAPEALDGLILVQTMTRYRTLVRAQAKLKEQRAPEVQQRILSLVGQLARHPDQPERKLELAELTRGDGLFRPEAARDQVEPETFYDVRVSVQRDIYLYDVRADLPRIDKPALVTVASHDPYCQDCPKDLARALPRVHAVSFFESGHAPHLEEPEKFRESLRDWLTGQALPG